MQYSSDRNDLCHSKYQRIDKAFWLMANWLFNGKGPGGGAFWSTGLFHAFQDPTFFALIILLPAIVHIIIGNIIEPKIFGETFGLHPITVILSLIFWGMIWGIIGVLLAAPLTAIIKISFEKFETTKPISLFLEGKIHLKNN